MKQASGIGLKFIFTRVVADAHPPTDQAESILRELQKEKQPFASLIFRDMRN